MVSYMRRRALKPPGMDSMLARALDGALGVYAQALDSGVENFLQGPAIRPVFRSHN
jgi:glutamate-1-semialdehyde 2,1-aminomutase